MRKELYSQVDKCFPGYEFSIDIGWLLCSRLASLLSSKTGSIPNINTERDLVDADEDRLSRLPPKHLACQCLKWSICDSATGSYWLPGWNGVRLPGGALYCGPSGLETGVIGFAWSVSGCPSRLEKQRPPPRQGAEDVASALMITALIHRKGLFSYSTVACVILFYIDLQIKQWDEDLVRALHSSA